MCSVRALVQVQEWGQVGVQGSGSSGSGTSGDKVRVGILSFKWYDRLKGTIRLNFP